MGEAAAFIQRQTEITLYSYRQTNNSTVLLFLCSTAFAVTLWRSVAPPRCASVVCGVFMLSFSFGSAHLEPRSQWCQKKTKKPVLIHKEKPKTNEQSWVELRHAVETWLHECRADGQKLFHSKTLINIDCFSPEKPVSDRFLFPIQMSLHMWKKI